MDLSYLNTYTPGWVEGHMTPTEEVLSLWRDIKSKTDFKHIFEIGTNAGHSAAIILELFPDVKVTSIDIGRHAYTRPAVAILKERFGDRFDYIERSTVDYFNDLKAGRVVFPEGVDIINIDGDHSVNGAKNDIELALHTNVEYVLIDDFKMYGVPEAYNTHKDKLVYVCEYDYHYKREAVSIALTRQVR